MIDLNDNDAVEKLIFAIEDELRLAHECIGTLDHLFFNADYTEYPYGISVFGHYTENLLLQMLRDTTISVLARIMDADSFREDDNVSLKWLIKKLRATEPSEQKCWALWWESAGRPYHKSEGGKWMPKEATDEQLSLGRSNFGKRVSEVSGRLTKLEESFKPLKTLRHKLVSHRDMKHAINPHLLPPIKFEQVKSFYSDMKDLLDEVLGLLLDTQIMLETGSDKHHASMFLIIADHVQASRTMSSYIAHNPESVPRDKDIFSVKWGAHRKDPDLQDLLSRAELYRNSLLDKRGSQDRTT